MGAGGKPLGSKEGGVTGCPGPKPEPKLGLGPTVSGGKAGPGATSALAGGGTLSRSYGVTGAP